MPMLGISQGWDYVAIAGGGALIALFSLEKLLLLVLAPERELTAEPRLTAAERV